MTTHTITPSVSPSPEDTAELLTLSSLPQLFPTLSDEPCERFATLLDFYVEQGCETDLQAQLAQHEETCEPCATLTKQLNAWRNSLIMGVENMKPTITIEDAEASLRDLLHNRWEELELDDLGLEELRDELLSQDSLDATSKVASHRSEDSSNDSSPISLVHDEESLLRARPTRALNTSRRRIISLACTVAAAAFLFAYGPGLIETDLKESESEFPETSALHTSGTPDAPDASSTLNHATTTPQELPRWTPLIDLKGVVISRVDDEEFTLQRVTLSPLNAHDSRALVKPNERVHYSLRSSISAERSIKVDLHSKNVSAAQQEGLLIRQRDAVQSGSGVLIGSTPVKYYQTQQLEMVEYVSRGRHYQWSAPIQAQSGSAHAVSTKSLLIKLTRRHLSR